MNDLEFVLRLRQLGVKFWLEGDAVRFQAPRGVLTPELREQMKGCKAVIHDMLRQAGAPGEATAALPPIVPVPRDRPLPLSYQQQGVWIRWQMEPGGTTYNMPSALRLLGALDQTALGRSLEALLARHEILRTTFHAHAEGFMDSPGGASQSDASFRPERPRQVIHAHVPFELPILDLGHLPANAREAALRAEIDRELGRPFDLARGPLLRARLICLGVSDHVLLVNMHHIVADAWSMSVLAREIALLYGALCKSEPLPLSPVKVHYADYAAWQQRLLECGELEPALAFWKRKLGDAPRALDLPTERSRTPSASSAGAELVFEITGQDIALARAVGRRANATLFMTLLAAFEVLLARHSGQNDFLLGTAVAGRSRTETEDMLGLFVNLVVLRAQLSHRMRFFDLLAQVKESVIEAQAHQHIPFERLVQELAPERAHGRTPLVQAVFNFVNTPDATLELPGLRVEPIELADGTSKMDLSLAIFELRDRLVCTMHYRTELYARATIERMARHYRNVLRMVVRDPEQRVADLPMLDRDERATMIEAWNATRAERPASATLHGLVTAQAQRTPDAIAVWSERGALTYRELEARAGRCAGFLRARGVGPETAVALCMERSLAQVAWVLGILAAGGAYLPLPPRGPAARVRGLIEDARVAIVIADAELHAMFEDVPAALIDGQFEPDVPAGKLPQVAPDQLAYILYTSGSTGQPKGVMVSHRALCNHLLYRQEACPLAPDDGFIHKASAVFDIALWELFAPLIAGARVVLARPGGQRDCAYLARLAAVERATHIHFPPFLLALFLDEQQCPSLRRVFCGGEPMTGALAARFHERYPDAELIHQYGPTEATIDATTWRVIPAPAEARIPIGKPIANTRAYVLDESLEPVPIGTVAELYIGGEGVARGYLGRPALTAERFVPDPFSGQPGLRLYRTGDRVRWLADGTLEFVGRRDHQVKIRGVRVELGEIEAALRRHPGILDAVAVLRTGADELQRLIAYVVPRSGAAPRQSELREFLLQHVPEPMVPAAMSVLEDLPRTSTGKVDRAALPDIEERLREDDGAYAVARTDIEQTLCAMFAEVLRTDHVGIHDDFFASGGDSLLATGLAARIHERFGHDLGLGNFFAAPTVAAVAEFLARSSAAPQDVPLIVPLRAHGGRIRLFCLHPAGGRLHVYQRMAELLDADIEVHGVQSRAAGDPSREHTSVQDMVTSYADAIHQAQPHGPCYLLGWSMGGVLAVGVAHELEARGRRVAFVGLLDAYPGAFLTTHVAGDPLRGLALAMGGELAAGYDALGEDERARIRACAASAPPEQRLARVLAEARARGIIDPGISLELIERDLRLIDRHRQLLESYAPPRVAVPLDVWWAGSDDERPDWALHTPNPVALGTFDGDHFSILREPRCRLVARAVSERVHQAAAGRERDTI